MSEHPSVSSGDTLRTVEPIGCTELDLLLGAVPPREERILLAIFDYDVQEEKVRKGGSKGRDLWIKKSGTRLVRQRF